MRKAATYNRVMILVIEDKDEHWAFIEMAIQKTFNKVVIIRVASATAAEAFLERCLVEPWDMPKLILQDLYLPSLDDGLQLLNRIKTMSASHKVIPIIILSSSSLRVNITKAYEAGISSCCLKPTSLQGWVSLFERLRIYWLETVTLPPQQYFLF